MTFICLWSPAAAREKELLQQLVPSLLGAAPRVLLGTNGIVWADARGMSAEPLARDLLGVFREKGVEKVRAALSISPICAEVAARHGKGALIVTHSGYGAGLSRSISGRRARAIALAVVTARWNRRRELRRSGEARSRVGRSPLRRRRSAAVAAVESRRLAPHLHQHPPSASERFARLGRLHPQGWRASRLHHQRARSETSRPS